MTNDRSLIMLGDVTPNNIGQLRKLNAVIFPVPYTDKFYTSVLEAPLYSRIAYFNDCPVGGVCVRKEAQADKTNHLYIMTLGVLAPYRNLGVGKALLDYVWSLVKQTPQTTSVYLHVQVGNDEALRFYKNHGFMVEGTAADYYKNTTPTDAQIVRKAVDGAAS